MALSKKIFPKVAAAGGVASAEQNLILNLDANDVDSYDGDGSIWYDISEHDVTVPLSDNADDLELHLNASDSTSYNPTSGTTTWSDISGNSRDATMTSMGNSNFDIDNGGYFDFDGSNDYMTVTGNSAFYPTTTTGITGECWFTSDTTDDGENLVNNWTSTGGWRLWTAGSSLYIDLRTSSATLAGRANAGTVSDNTWHHAVFTLENSTSTATLKLYLDGELIDTASSSAAMGTTVQNLNIGRRSDVTHDKLNGKIGGVRIYSKVLSASEIGQNYRHGRDYIYTSLVDDTNLELHLDAEDLTSSSTTWNDKTSNSNNGTIAGAEFDAELGNWLDFERADDNNNVTISDSSSLDITTNITLEAWVNVESYVSHERLIWKNDAYVLYASASGVWTFYVNAAQGIVTTTHNVTGTWFHIAATYNGSQTAIYINGEQKNTTSKTGAISTNNNNLFIGGDGTSARYFDGKIGQTRIYSTALSSDQVMQNYLFTKNNYPNVYHATAVNSPTFSSSYFDFDDTNSSNTDYFTLSNDVLQVLSGKEGMSVAAWVNFDSVSGFQNIVATYAGGSVNLFNLLSFNAKFRFYLYGSDFEGSQSSADVFSTGVWTHIVAVFDGTQTHASGTGGRYQAYINGSEITMNTVYTGPNIITVPSAASNVPLRIAAGFGGGSIGEDSFDGKISKIRIYDRAITSAEVTTIFDEGSGN